MASPVTSESKTPVEKRKFGQPREPSEAKRQKSIATAVETLRAAPAQTTPHPVLLSSARHLNLSLGAGDSTAEKLALPFPFLRPDLAVARSSSYAASSISTPSEPNPYQTAAEEVGNTQVTEDTQELFKQITVMGQKKNIDYRALGKGDSFICYKITDDNLVVKIFASIQDASTRRKRRAGPNPVTGFNIRMDHLYSNYLLASHLGVSTALILNCRTLKTNGFVLQEFTPALKVTWGSSTPLSDQEKSLIEQFCSTFEKTMTSPDVGDWELRPKNFGVVNGTLKLFDFSDRPLENHKETFFQSAIEWVNNNTEAREIVTARLQNMRLNPIYHASHSDIDNIIQRLCERTT